VRLSVTPEQDGERLDALLAGHLGSRTRAQRLITAGQVLVDGAPARKGHKVRGGEVLDVDDSDVHEPMALGDGPPAPHEVVWEDEHLLVVDKPAGVVVHPAAGHESGTLVQALAGRVAGGGVGGDPNRPGVVHRLDRDTSGLLVVAKADSVLRALQAALQARDIDREYVALVEGRPPALTGTIDAPIGRDRRDRTRHSTDTDNPRAAVTHFEITEALPATTLLRVRLETGRTHQIRAHLLAIGHPVAGDPEYGHAGLLGLQRQFLHAGRLAFTHPVTGEEVEVRSPLPEDLREALDRARDSNLDS
jgi:23S rRNA pseudouridine1911/1915/1917 synthase